MCQVNSLRCSLWVGVLVGFLCMVPAGFADTYIALEVGPCDGQVEQRIVLSEDQPSAILPYDFLVEPPHQSIQSVVVFLAFGSQFSSDWPAIRAPPRPPLCVKIFA